jgi:hypothetical protein
MGGRMTDERKYGTFAVLWLAFMAMLTVLAAMSSHPTIRLEDFFPNHDPGTWVVPGLIVGPPLLIVAAVNTPPNFSKVFGWTALIIQGLSVILLLLLFTGMFIFG